MRHSLENNSQFTIKITNSYENETFTACTTNTTGKTVTTSELKTNYLMPYVFSESSISAYSLPSAVIVSLYTYGYNVNRFGKADFLMEISPAGSISTAVHIEDAEMFRGSDRNLSFALAIGALVASSCWLLYTYVRVRLIILEHQLQLQHQNTDT